MQLANSHGYPTGGSPSDDQLAKLDRLGSTPPSGFDRACLHVVQSAYQDALSLSVGERTTNDDGMRSFIDSTQPEFSETETLVSDESSM